MTPKPTTDAMNPKIKKLVFVVQDVETSDKHKIAVLFGDIHLHAPDHNGRSTVSFQLALIANKELSRVIRGMTNEVLVQNMDTKDKAQKQ